MLESWEGPRIVLTAEVWVSSTDLELVSCSLSPLPRLISESQECHLIKPVPKPFGLYNYMYLHRNPAFVITVLD